MRHAFDEVREVLAEAEALGGRELPDGTRLIGHVPHIGPEAYLHTVYAPLSDEELEVVEGQICRRLPSPLKAFYKCANGLYLFSGALSIDGLRREHSRTGDAARQPFSIDTPNVMERPTGSDPAAVFFGGYDWDGSLLFMMPSEARVFRCERDVASILTTWPTLENMLVSEAARLASAFDGDGRQIDEDEPTTPG